MKYLSILRRSFTLTCLLSCPAIATAGDLPQEPVMIEPVPTLWDNLHPYADFRFRYENDWQSVNSSGQPRDDRQRLRVRGRVGLTFEPNEMLLFDVRARTGNSDSQQSPHLTIHDFDEGDPDDFDGFLDKYYVRYQDERFSLWGGRNAFPFWKQNEMFWSDDVTITGAAMSLAPEFFNGALTTTIGAFFLPDGAWQLNGQLYAGQIKYHEQIGGFELTAAEGFYYFDGKDGAEYLSNGNGSRDYAILGNQFQAAHDVFGVPMAVGVDVYYNFRDYPADSADAFTAANADEKFGSVLSLTLGRLESPGDFQLGYYYAWLETFAANASYAEDNWVRWGSATQTDATDLRGHEWRMTYRLLDRLKIMARLYAVDAITSEQDGMRFRVDFDYKF